MQIKPDEITSILKSRIEGLDTTSADLAEVGTVLGFLQQGAPIPEFPSYVQTCLALAADPAFCASLDAEQPGLEEHVVGPRCPQCDHVTLEAMSAGLLHHQTFAAYAAVYGVAQALHNTLLCNASGCPPREPVRPWQVRPGGPALLRSSVSGESGPGTATGLAPPTCSNLPTSS